MRHIQGSDRAQTLLLPAAVEDYVGADNPVRAIEAFVDGFDLAKAGFVRAEAKETGRPGYHPGDLLKLYLYGYLNRVRSSRRLEAECRRNLEVIWLLRGLRPDFKTVADFRRENAPAFKAAFRHFVVLCRQLDLFGRELLAIDGTRLKAVNSKERNFTREKLKTMLANADARLAEYLAELAKADDQDGGPPAGTSPVKNLAEKIATLQKRRDGYVTIQAELERTGESQVSLTDPDSRAMATYPKVGVGYNAQVAVDAKHKLIVEQEVTNLGRPGAARTHRHPGQGDPWRGDDPGHGGSRILQGRGHRRLRGGGHRGLRAQAAGPGSGGQPRPLPQGSVRLRRSSGRVPLSQRGDLVTPRRVDHARPPAAPPLSPDCLPTLPAAGAVHLQPSWRRIARWEGEAVLDAMAARLAANPQMTRLRRNTVEHPFGTIKHAMNQGHFLLKGLRQVRAEFSLSALAYNLLRVMNIVGVKALVEALRRRLRALATAPRRTHDLMDRFYARVFASNVCREQKLVPAGLPA